MTAAVVVDAVRHTSSTFIDHHGLHPPDVGDRFAIEDARAQGGFGAVRQVVGASTPLLLKVYDATAVAACGGADAIESALAQLAEGLARRVPASWPAELRAFPYWLADVRIDGAPALAALMLDLAAEGYEPCSFDPAAAMRHRKLPLHRRVELAQRFAERCATLELAGFVHGDLNPENLLVQRTTGDVQVIDLDAGAVGGHPLTAGKPDDCMPPEVKVVGHGGGGVDVTRYDPGAERWSIGSLVGYLLLGAHPGFFLRSMAPKVLEAYAVTKPGWPVVDEQGPLFTALRVNAEAYRRLRPEMASWPDGVQDELRRFFAAGLHGYNRPSAGDWLRALIESQQPPVIELLAVDPEVCPAGTEVRISWRADRTKEVEVVGVGVGPPHGSLTVRVDRTSSFVVRAVNRYGTTEERTETVQVVVLPPITIRSSSPPPYAGRIDLSVPAVPITAASVGAPAIRPSTGPGPTNRPPRAPGRPSGLTRGPRGPFPRP